LAAQTILILEDDPSVRTLLVKTLSARGYEVRAAEDGLAGLTMLEAWTPDLLIVDVMMPRLDGMTFVRAIKARNDTKPIPVIFLTAKNDPKSMIAGINLGARYYITKPFVVEELISKIQKALGG
jgi:DNA-binding response OmpR family regulator